MMCAIQKGRKKIVVLFLEYGVDVHARMVQSGYTALFIAVQKGNTEIMGLLLDHGAELEVGRMCR